MMDRHAIAAYAVSYDSVDVLAQLARGYAVAYPLLSDAESRVIKQLRLLNVHIPPGHPWHGVPYPGTLLLDAQGRVVRKSFYADHRVRDSVARLLEDGFGVEPHVPNSSGVAPAQDTTAAGDVVATATLSASTTRPGQVHTLAVRLAPRAGREEHAWPTVELALASAEGVEMGRAVVEQDSGALTLRAPVTIRRREDVVLELSVHAPRGDGREPIDLSFRLPVRCVPNAPAAV